MPFKYDIDDYDSCTPLKSQTEHNGCNYDPIQTADESQHLEAPQSSAEVFDSCSTSKLLNCQSSWNDKMLFESPLRPLSSQIDHIPGPSNVSLTHNEIERLIHQQQQQQQQQQHFNNLDTILHSVPRRELSTSSLVSSYKWLNKNYFSPQSSINGLSEERTISESHSSFYEADFGNDTNSLAGSSTKTAITHSNVSSSLLSKSGYIHEGRQESIHSLTPPKFSPPFSSKYYMDSELPCPPQPSYSQVGMHKITQPKNDRSTWDNGIHNNNYITDLNYTTVNSVDNISPSLHMDAVFDVLRRHRLRSSSSLISDRNEGICSSMTSAPTSFDLFIGKNESPTTAASKHEQDSNLTCRRKESINGLDSPISEFRITTDSREELNHGTASDQLPNKQKGGGIILDLSQFPELDESVTTCNSKPRITTTDHEMSENVDILDLDKKSTISISTNIMDKETIKDKRTKLKEDDQQVRLCTTASVTSNGVKPAPPVILLKKDNQTNNSSCSSQGFLKNQLSGLNQGGFSSNRLESNQRQQVAVSQSSSAVSLSEAKQPAEAFDTIQQLLSLDLYKPSYQGCSRIYNYNSSKSPYNPQTGARYDDVYDTTKNSHECNNNTYPRYHGRTKGSLFSLAERLASSVSFTEPSTHQSNNDGENPNYKSRARDKDQIYEHANDSATVEDYDPFRSPIHAMDNDNTCTNHLHKINEMNDPISSRFNKQRIKNTSESKEVTLGNESQPIYQQLLPLQQPVISTSTLQPTVSHQSSPIESSQPLHTFRTTSSIAKYFESNRRPFAFEPSITMRPKSYRQTHSYQQRDYRNSSLSDYTINNNYHFSVQEAPDSSAMIVRPSLGLCDSEAVVFSHNERPNDYTNFQRPNPKLRNIGTRSCEGWPSKKKTQSYETILNHTYGPRHNQRENLEKQTVVSPPLSGRPLRHIRSSQQAPQQYCAEIKSACNLTQDDNRQKSSNEPLVDDNCDKLDVWKYQHKEKLHPDQAAIPEVHIVSIGTGNQSGDVTVMASSNDDQRLPSIYPMLSQILENSLPLSDDKLSLDQASNCSDHNVDNWHTCCTNERLLKSRVSFGSLGPYTPSFQNQNHRDSLHQGVCTVEQQRSSSLTPALQTQSSRNTVGATKGIQHEKPHFSLPYSDRVTNSYQDCPIPNIDSFFSFLELSDSSSTSTTSFSFRPFYNVHPRAQHTVFALMDDNVDFWQSVCCSSSNYTNDRIGH